MKRDRICTEEPSGASVIEFENDEAAEVAYHRGFADFTNGRRLVFDKAGATREGNRILTRTAVTSIWTTT